MEDLLMSILSIILAVLIGGLLLLWGNHCSCYWRGASTSGARLPKGSFGWPIIGESLSLARNPETYVSSHVKRYGKIFKSSLFLQPTILGTTTEFAKFVASNNDFFGTGWFANFSEVLGPKGIMFLDSPRHMPIKRIFQKQLLPEALRTQVNVLETIVLEHMATWEQKGTLNGKEGTAKITMETAIWLLLGLRGIGSTSEGKDLQKNLESLVKGIASFPANLPGSAFNKGLKVANTIYLPVQEEFELLLNFVINMLRSSLKIATTQRAPTAKSALTKYFKYLLKKRKGEENPQNDILGVVLAAQEDPKAREEVKDLDDDTIVDNLVLFWFAGYDTSSTTLTWILKFLVDNPEVFRRVQAEQQEILKSKDPSAGAPRLAWEDYRRMVYTQKFFQEVQRTLSIVPFVMRKTTQDVEYEGHLIPKGWAVCAMLNVIHSDPTIYPDPQSFNPDRFDAIPKPFTYLPFSAGAHMCPGLEIVKLISLMFIHHLTTTYVYEAAAPDKGTEYNTFLIPKGGYPINIRRRI